MSFYRLWGKQTGFLVGYCRLALGYVTSVMIIFSDSWRAHALPAQTDHWRRHVCNQTNQTLGVDTRGFQVRPTWSRSAFIIW
jgi:hypothetical protein